MATLRRTIIRGVRDLHAKKRPSVRPGALVRMLGKTAQRKRHENLLVKISLTQRALNSIEADILAGKKIPQSYFKGASAGVKITAPLWIPIRTLVEHYFHSRGEQRIVAKLLGERKIRIAPKGRKLSEAEIDYNRMAIHELRRQLATLEKENDEALKKFRKNP